MSKRRMLILLLFFVIGVFAISRTLLLRQDAEDMPHEQYHPSRGAWHSDSAREGQTWGRLLDRLLVVTVTVPFIITALLLFVYSLQGE